MSSRWCILVCDSVVIQSASNTFAMKPVKMNSNHPEICFVFGNKVPGFGSDVREIQKADSPLHPL